GHAVGAGKAHDRVGLDGPFEQRISRTHSKMNEALAPRSIIAHALASRGAPSGESPARAVSLRSSPPGTPSRQTLPRRPGRRIPARKDTCPTSVVEGTRLFFVCSVVNRACT